MVQQHGFKFAEVSAKTNEKIFESIRDFGLAVGKEKSEKNAPQIKESGSQGSRVNSATTASQSSTVHINKQRESTQNLNYRKKCC